MAEHGKNPPAPSSVADNSPFDEPVVLPLEDRLDLHAFQPKDVVSVVNEYLDQCAQAGLRQLRITHGKGVGVQRNNVRMALSRHPAVLSYEDAPPEAGGWGATVVTLKGRI